MNRAPTFELNVVRRIRAPREKVFDAFVKPELMKVWMCPRGMSVPEVTADARPGGRFRVTMRARDRQSFAAFGEYREVSRPERLIYTWQWEGEFAMPAETLITVSFSERDGETEVRMHHSGFPDAPRRDSHSGGWDSCFNRLTDAYDARGSAAAVTLLGDGRSSYVRTARMGLAEKGVKYTHEPYRPHTPEIDALHPFGRVPAFRDGRCSSSRPARSCAMWRRLSTVPRCCRSACGTGRAASSG
jgi:glutathione S-transferase